MNNLRVEERVLKSALPNSDRSWVVKDYCGPCLVCDKDIKYDDSRIEQYGGIKWLQKHFAPKQRTAHIANLRGEVEYSSLQPKTLHAFVCTECRVACWQSCKAVAEREKSEYEARCEAQKQWREKRNFHLAWRKPNPGEFDGWTVESTEFRVISPDFEVFEITFRWKPARKGECRGKSPRHVVGMWVEGKLVARYFGWNLAPFSEDDQAEWSPGVENVEPIRRQDVFAKGFCMWLEQKWQNELKNCSPDFVVDFSSPRRSWPDFASLPSPALIHVRWLDGTIHSDVIHALHLPDVAQFMKKHLRFRIARRSFVPMDQ